MSDIYGGPDDELTPVAVIDGPCGRKLNNAITMRFVRNGTEEPIATALQSGADGVGKKLGILFGFKNGSTGTHELTHTGGATLSIPVVDLEPTQVTRDGTATFTITRGETTTVTAPDGSTVLRFLPDPVEAVASAYYRMRLEDGTGAHVATLDVIREVTEYDEIGVEDVLNALDWLSSPSFGSDPGGALKLPFFGCRAVLYREPTQLELDALLAACVEIGIGVRPYIKEMGDRGAAWT